MSPLERTVTRPGWSLRGDMSLSEWPVRTIELSHSADDSYIPTTSIPRPRGLDLMPLAERATGAIAELTPASLIFDSATVAVVMVVGAGWLIFRLLDFFSEDWAAACRNLPADTVLSAGEWDLDEDGVESIFVPFSPADVLALAI